MSVLHLLAIQLGGGAAGWLGFAPLIFIFAIFYFLLIMPQQRKQKKKMRKRFCRCRHPAPNT